MASLIHDPYAEVHQLFKEYQRATRRFNDAMRQVGIQTGNVDPLCNYAEVIVAHRANGAIQRATNAGYDVLTPDGVRIQVKSLRVSSTKPEDNPINWNAATRCKDGSLIAADQLAVVVYLDSAPYAIVMTAVTTTDRFPVLNVKDLYFRHVEKLLNAPPGEGGAIEAVRLSL